MNHEPHTCFQCGAPHAIVDFIAKVKLVHVTYRCSNPRCPDRDFEFLRRFEIPRPPRPVLSLRDRDALANKSAETYAQDSKALDVELEAKHTPPRRPWSPIIPPDFGARPPRRDLGLAELRRHEPPLGLLILWDRWNATHIPTQQSQ